MNISFTLRWKSIEPDLTAIWMVDSDGEVIWERVEQVDADEFGELVTQRAEARWKP